MDENAFMPESIFQEHYDIYFNMTKEAKADRRMDIMRDLYTGFIDTFFCRGMKGLELVNLYMDNPNPLTGKKLRLIRGEGEKAETISRISV